MSKAQFKTNREAFNKRNDSFKDMVMGHMAQDIEVNIKMNAGTPVDSGDMKAEVRHFRSERTGMFRVESEKEYSAYQERGMRRDGTHVIRNHTTAGTGPGWFRRAIDMVWKNRLSYIDEARRALDL